MEEKTGVLPLNHEEKTEDSVAIGDTLTVQFRPGNKDQATILTRINGRIAFLPDKLFVGVKAYDTWEVRLKGVSPTGNVYFVMPVKMVIAPQDSDILNGLDYESVRECRFALSFMRNWRHRLETELLLKDDLRTSLYFARRLSDYIDQRSLPERVRVRLADTVFYTYNKLKLKNEIGFERPYLVTTLCLAYTSRKPEARLTRLKEAARLLESGFSQYAHYNETQARILFALHQACLEAGQKDKAIEYILRAYSLKSWKVIRDSALMLLEKAGRFEDLEALKKTQLDDWQPGSEYLFAEPILPKV